MKFENLKVKEINCVIKYTPKSKHFSVNNRTNHIIGIQLSGNSIHHFKDRDMNLPGSCIYFFNQKDAYTVDVLKLGTAFSVHFTTYEPIDTETFFIKITNTTEVIRMLDLLEKKFLSKHSELSLLSDFYNFCEYFNRIYQKTFSPKDKRMIAAQSYINTHFTESDCLTKAFENSGLSRRRFNDLFKNCFDITPNRYIINLKIDYAKNYCKPNTLIYHKPPRYAAFRIYIISASCLKKKQDKPPRNTENILINYFKILSLSSDFDDIPKG